jgi:hypothetical protein
MRRNLLTSEEHAAWVRRQQLRYAKPLPTSKQPKLDLMWQVMTQEDEEEDLAPPTDDGAGQG